MSNQSVGIVGKIIFPAMFISGIALFSLGMYNINQVQELQYPIIAIDEYVEKSDGHSAEEQPVVGAEDVTITAGTSVTVNVASDTVELYYDNPSSNRANTRLSLVVDDVIVATSGLIEPGYALSEMHDVNLGELEYGYYDGHLVIDTFDPDTGERSIVNNRIAVGVQIRA